MHLEIYFHFLQIWIWKIIAIYGNSEFGIWLIVINYCDFWEKIWFAQQLFDYDTSKRKIFLY